MAAATDKGSGGTGALYLADLGYPMLPQNATEQEKFDELQDYLFRLTEALRWTLEHLDESNFNSNFFLDFAVGELYEPLEIVAIITSSRTQHYDVEEDLGVIDGDVTETPSLDSEGFTWYGHTPVSVVAENADGEIPAVPMPVENITEG